MLNWLCSRMQALPSDFAQINLHPVASQLTEIPFLRDKQHAAGMKALRTGKMNGFRLPWPKIMRH